MIKWKNGIKIRYGLVTNELIEWAIVTQCEMIHKLL